MHFYTFFILKFDFNLITIKINIFNKKKRKMSKNTTRINNDLGGFNFANELFR